MNEELSFASSLDAAINKNKLDLIAGKAEISPTILKFTAATHVPIRTHKKKRIRKKWAKRYGTKPATAKYEAHGFSRFNDAGEYEFEIQKMYMKGILI